jgi:Flp pilus assembly protein TadD
MTPAVRTPGSLLRTTALATLAALALAAPLGAFAQQASEESTVKLRAPGNPSNYVVKPKIHFPETATAPPTSMNVMPAQEVRYTPSGNIAAGPEPLPDAIIPNAAPQIASVPPSPLPPAGVRYTPVENIAASPEPLPDAIIPNAAAMPESHVALAPLPPPPPASLVDTSEVAPLPDATKRILDNIPSKLDHVKPKGGSVAISRISPEIQGIVAESQPQIESHDSIGLSIKVQRPGLDTNYELNRAYTALMGGDTEVAIDVYKNILSTEPKNQDALFGLAATYHRLGDFDKARTYYGQLLAVNANHREGLNNFLALASEESPEDALAELEILEKRNPDFSPIPAQQGVVLSKIGQIDLAREKMLRAIALSPENLTYKYNLAIMLDSRGDYDDAGALYRLLIDAGLKGQPLPAPIETIQKRLNYITTASMAIRQRQGS